MRAVVIATPQALSVHTYLPVADKKVGSNESQRHLIFSGLKLCQLHFIDY